MNEKILLNKNKGKTSTNVNNSLTIQLKGSKRILPCDPMETSISEIDVYNNERENCSKIRLTVQVNPICSNVLFNNLTEIVRNEGTNDVKCLNYIELSDVNSNLEDDDFKWDDKNLRFKQVGDFTESGSTVVNGIRDTQLNNEANGFSYHCGIDIFNNHLLRSKTFKTVCPMENETGKPIFNTIQDWMRTYDGIDIKGYIDRKATSKRDFGQREKLHLYTNEEVISYKEAVSTKLIEKNGWFGFTNVGKIKVYNDKIESIYNNDYDWFKVINTRKPCDFIDMYPDRELYFFTPKYNSYRQRVEKNWLYCITYPSSSTTDVPFIKKFDNNTTGLKIACFDDTIKHKSGINAIKIWSVSKHGLSKNNIINLYKNNERILTDARVLEVVDEYTFYIFNDGVKISEKWLELPDNVGDTVEVNGVVYNVSNDRKYVHLNSKRYFLLNYKKANIDDNAQDVSFKRVVENNEVSYYVRIFSKLPNWKFAKQKPTELLLENDKKPNHDNKVNSFINSYRTTNNDFDSHVGKLAFSKNIYNDDVAEIVFTDDIDISVLKDNLNRPLSELYLTIIKNNAGYREWYGKGDDGIKLNDPIIEYSHCFGKVNCAFKLSEESISNLDYNNVLMINNIDNTFDRNGLDITYINDGERNGIDDDEIQYEPYKEYSGDSSFYGDLCCYSEPLCDEQSIQMIDFRFNTAQRELTNNFESYLNFSEGIVHDEIISDDYDDNGFKVKMNTISNAVNRREGYYYKPHYKIPIKSFDNLLTTIYPRFLTIRQLNSSNANFYNIVTLENHLLGNNSILNIYDKENKKYYYGKVINIVNNKSIDFEIYSDDLFNNKININASNKKNFKFFIKSENIPSYAYLMKDGSCRYVYRELHQNGFDDNTDIPTYPFTNGSLYVNKTLNLFVRRQNSKGASDLRSKVYPYDIVTNSISFEKENKYYNEEEIEC